MENRIVLGIDNSMDFLSIALSIEERLIEERQTKKRRQRYCLLKYPIYFPIMAIR
ncbi:MAG: hypothetical protein NT178_01540 [Proteobacteria bacterium]|nr:hypothetical protein [Pseudomonadota bacterium]